MEELGKGGIGFAIYLTLKAGKELDHEGPVGAEEGLVHLGPPHPGLKGAPGVTGEKSVQGELAKGALAREGEEGKEEFLEGDLGHVRGHGEQPEVLQGLIIPHRIQVIPDNVHQDPLQGFISLPKRGLLTGQKFAEFRS